MKKIQISEKKLINIIKRILKESEEDFKYYLINEQNNDVNLLTPKPIQSDYLGKNGSFEKKLYGGLSSDKYFELLKQKKPNTIKKLRLVFPQSGWEEIALKLLKSLGIVTGIFKSLSAVITFIKNLSNKNVKTDELVIGSHGSFGTLLITQKDGEYFFDNSFLESFKGIIHTNTKIFFTACGGADDLATLKNAAEKIGVGVYGASGLYNYIINQSQKGFYWCSSEKFNPPVNKKIYPVNFNSHLLEVSIVREYDNDYIPIKGIITIKNEVFDTPSSPISFTSSKPTWETIGSGYDQKKLAKYEINFISEIQDYFYNKTHHSSNNPYNRKYYELEKLDKDLIDYCKEKFISGEIIVEIMNNNQKLNIKSLPMISESGVVTNEFLLKNNFCKKIDSSPISWI